MEVHRYPLTLQAAYSELLEQLEIAEIEGLLDQERSFIRRTRAGRRYWYARRFVSERGGDRRDERYLGPETPALLERIEGLRAEAALARSAAGNRRALVRQLHAGGYLALDRRTGRVLEELARAGVFRLDGVLVGTHAFRCYPAVLGARLEARLAVTGDVDIAQQSSVSLAIAERADPALVDALAAAERFVAIPALDRKAPASAWQTEDRQLRVDVLTPLVGKARSGTVELPVLGVHAKPLRFLDFLLAETLRAAVLTGSGVLVRVPVPERYALHKLIVAQRRIRHESAKSRKDLAQAESLLAVLVQDRPDELLDLWQALRSRGPAWERDARRSLARLPEDIRSHFRESLRDS